MKITKSELKEMIRECLREELSNTKRALKEAAVVSDKDAYVAYSVYDGSEYQLLNIFTDATAATKDFTEVQVPFFLTGFQPDESSFVLAYTKLSDADYNLLASDADDYEKEDLLREIDNDPATAELHHIDGSINNDFVQFYCDEYGIPFDPDYDEPFEILNELSDNEPLFKKVIDEFLNTRPDLV